MRSGSELISRPAHLPQRFPVPQAQVSWSVFIIRSWLTLRLAISSLLILLNFSIRLRHGDAWKCRLGPNRHFRAVDTWEGRDRAVEHGVRPTQSALGLYL